MTRQRALQLGTGQPSSIGRGRTDLRRLPGRRGFHGRGAHDAMLAVLADVEEQSL